MVTKAELAANFANRTWDENVLLKAEISALKHDLERMRECEEENARLKADIEGLRSALAYAIDEADEWYDESRGCGSIKTDEMKAARKLLAGKDRE